MSAVKSVKKALYNGAKTCAFAVMRRCPPLRKKLRQVVWGRRTKRYAALANSVETKEHTVLFASFKGRSYSCSPRALFELMQADERYADFTFYWAFLENSIEKYRYLEGKYRNLTLVTVGSVEFYRALAQSSHWIVNSRIAEHLIPKKDQVYVQCWHGTPLKRLGFDIVSGTTSALSSTEESADRYRLEASKWSYLVSPSRFTSECLASAFDLDARWAKENILEIGYPRNDSIVNVCKDEQALAALKDRLACELGFDAGKRLLLYAPTWRDNEYKSGVGYVQDVMIDFDLLQQHLGDDWVVLFRPHYFVANEFDFAKYEGFIANAAHVADINELYCIADVLMTDYSSVFFDYACTGRPMVFFQPDLADYQDHVRGFYLDPVADLPGPHCESSVEVVEAIEGISSYFDDYAERYEVFRQRFCPMEDGRAAERLAERLFGRH